MRPKRPDLTLEGYWNLPELTVDVSRNWWYHSDIGRVEGDRFLYFVNRKAD